MDKSNSLDKDVYQKAIRYMIIKQDAKQALDVLLERETQKKAKYEAEYSAKIQESDMELKNLTRMRDALEKESDISLDVSTAKNGADSEKRTQEIMARVEFQGRFLSKIIRDILRLAPVKSKFANDYILEQIKTNRRDMYPTGKKQKASFNAIVWKEAKTLEAAGQLEIIKRSRREGNEYKKLK